MSKVCLKCGNQVEDGNVQFCPSCGEAFEKKGCQSGLLTAAKIFMIITCVGTGWLIIPLAWLIPMTCRISKRQKDNEKLSTGFKICVLLFANIVAGILLLCDEEA